MDAYPRIPRDRAGSSSPRSPGNSIPAAGTVTIASVEEDLGDGRYTLRLGGNRISVTSRTALTPGQSLILKSETTLEGKTILVVQGPALPDPNEPFGKSTYSPRQKPGAQTESGSGSAEGGHIAAGVTRNIIQAAPSQPVSSLLGAVLEPLPDFQSTAKTLLAQAEKAKTQWEKYPDDSPKTGIEEKPAQISQQSTPETTDASRQQPVSPEAAQTTPPEYTAPDATALSETPSENRTGSTPCPAETRTGYPAQTQQRDTTNIPVERPEITQSPASDAQQRPEGSNTSSSPEVRPPMDQHVFIKEILTQLVKAADLPLASPSADTQALGVAFKVSETIADKAATILLRAAGLTPDEPTIGAAKALMENSVPIERNTVQAMLALATEMEGCADREAIFRAAARQLLRDIPIAAPLASGLVDVMNRKAGVYDLMDKAAQILAAEPRSPETRPLMDAAKDLINLLHVDLGRGDAAAALERYISTFGRETLGRALALVESSAQAVLENRSDLAKIDNAMTAVLNLLEREMAVPASGDATGAPPANEQTGTPPTTGQRPPESLPAEAESQPVAETEERPVRPLTQPVILMNAVSAYLKTPNPFQGLESAQLPSMPEVATLPSATTQAQPPQPVVNAPAQQQPPVTAEQLQALANIGNIEIQVKPVAASPGAVIPFPEVNLDAAGNPAQPVPIPARPGQAPSVASPQIHPITPTTAEAALTPPIIPPGISQTGAILQPPAGTTQTPQTVVPEQLLTSGHEPWSASSGDLQSPSSASLPADGGLTLEQRERRGNILMQPDLLFQLPGVNRPEVDFLRPSGRLDRFLNTATNKGDKVASILRDLLSDDPEKAEQAIRDLPKKDLETLRETASRLSRMERDLVRQDSQLNRLADAAGTLRDLGRQLLAVKAENLAGQDRNPATMLAEVPFKLADNGGDGRMQMFYRKAKGGKEGWSSRIILDLNTTSLGPVLGDMRFFGADIILNLFVEKKDAAEFLSQSAEELTEHLLGKGFRVKPRFMVLPPPPAPPQIHADRPKMREETPSESLPVPGTRRKGRLDTKA